MKCLAVCFVALATVLPSVAADNASKPIDQLKWMIGTWEAQEGTGASAETVRLKAWLAASGAAILYHVDVIHGDKETPRYDGMYYWLPAAKTFAIRQVSIVGNAVEGEYSQTGDHASLKEKVYNADGTTSFIQANYTIEPDKFHFVAQFKASESKDWIPALDSIYHRISPGAQGK